MTEALNARRRAEDDVQRILSEWERPKLALLVHMLALSGWTRTLAEGELRKVKWWLA